MTAVTLSLIASMLFAFAPSVPAADVEDPQAETSLLQNKKVLGDFDQMVKQRRIRALVAYSKTFYFISQGRQRGFTYEILKEFERYVNKTLKTKTLGIRIVFIPVSRDQLIPALKDGRGDIAASNLTITDRRLETVDFSNPLFSGVKELIVSGPAASPVNGIDDLAGKEIHVRRSSSYHESLLALNETFVQAGKSKIRLVFADEVFEDEDLLEMVNAGLIPMIAMDSHKTGVWEKVFDQIKVHPDIAIRDGGRIAWAFRKNSPALASVVNEFVEKHKKGTLFGNILLKRYFKNTRYVKNSLSEAELKKFDHMVQLFRKYAAQYDFDYIMIAAQAYQESGLDHDRRSHAGAIGVMQVLPSTAADPNVGIPEIERLENNIHAGTKYLRFIVDRYFQDETIDDANRLLFAFAAYNAGPARVKGLRQQTAAMGLDPNVWFHNVEIAAAKSIGRETVQYVSNIYKYYVAYRMVLAQHEKKERLRKDKIAPQKD